MKKNILLLIFFTFSININAQWIAQNPGAGGQIQSFDCDPNTEGTVYLSSDVEGQYRTDDNGLSWKYIGHELRFNMTFGMTVEPNNANRIYSSGANGVHISDNKGENWSDIKLKGFPIRKVVVNPKNVNQIFAIMGWRQKKNIIEIDFSGPTNRSFKGKRMLFRSNDRGITWDTLVYNPQNGFRNIYSLDINSQNTNQLYIGTSSGLFLSNNSGDKWAKLPQPDNTFGCFGACLSPDGQYIYATFCTVDDPDFINIKTTTTSKLYVSKTNDITNNSWQAVDGNGWNLGETDTKSGKQDKPFNGAWWMPVFDPHSTSNQHKILIAPGTTARQGLYEGTFEYLPDGKLKSYAWQRVLYKEGSVNPTANGVSVPFKYDAGWEDFIPGSTEYTYTPTTWKTKKGIWTTSQQNMYYGDRTSAGFPYTNTWYNRYCETVANKGTKNETYKSRGTGSTVNYDGVGFNNYIIQAHADNGILESWDYGNSWATQSKPPTNQTESVCIANMGENKTPIVLAHGIPLVFGGFGVEGSIYAKKLNKFDKTDVWTHVAGGKNSRAGLPNAVTNQMVIDPNDSKRIILSMDKNKEIGGGVWEIPNVEMMFEQNAVVNGGHNESAKAPYLVKNLTDENNAEGTGRAALSNSSVPYVQIDPNNPNIIYATNTNGAFFMGKLINSKWQWTRKLLANGELKISVWSHNNLTYIALFGNLEKAIAGATAGQTLIISKNGAETWDIVMQESVAENIRKPNWYDKDKNRLLAGALIGYENKVFLSFHTFGTNKGFGVFEGIINDKTNQIAWKDFTANMEFPRIRRFQIVKNADNTTWMYASTQGTGFVKRQIFTKKQ
jgi:hypothetical protein